MDAKRTDEVGTALPQRLTSCLPLRGAKRGSAVNRCPVDIESRTGTEPAGERCRLRATDEVVSFKIQIKSPGMSSVPGDFYLHASVCLYRNGSKRSAPIPRSMVREDSTSCSVLKPGISGTRTTMRPGPTEDRR